MDIGCGPGNSIRNMILPALPNVKEIIAIDVLPDMIDFAKTNNASDKIEYHVANIKKWHTLDKWSEQISKVMSLFCLNWVNNQEEAFRNIYRLLKPGGEAALLFVLSTSFWDSYKLLIDNPKWSKYLKDANPHIPESHFKKYDASYYHNLLENIDFNVVICKDENKTYVFQDDGDCRDSVFSISGFSNYIPDNLKSEFKEDLFQGVLKFNGRSSDGRSQVNYTTLTALIQKPNM